jgi:hypothetical protein
MTYTAKTAQQLRNVGGTITEKISAELGLIETELGSITAGETLQQSKFANLNTSMVSSSSLAAAGIDLASGSDITMYGVWFAPVDITLIKMHDYITEAYVKDSTDAKIEIYNDAGTPAKLFTRTLTAAGEAAKASHSTSPESGKATVAAGTGIVLKAVNTGSSTGTGHAAVMIEYIER